MYHFAWSCKWTAVCTHLGFESFMEWAGQQTNIAQSWKIHQACGTPCHFDHLLREETLQRDWVGLLRQYDLPLIGLPIVNQPTLQNADGLPPPAVVFSKRVLEIIKAIDSPMFDEFGYRQRNEPFEIKSKEAELDRPNTKHWQGRVHNG